MFGLIMFHVIPQEEPCGDSSKCVGEGAGQPDSVQIIEIGEKDDGRNEVDELSAQTQEHGLPGNTDTLEELADDNLRTDYAEGAKADAESVGGYLNQLIV